MNPNHPTPREAVRRACVLGSCLPLLCTFAAAQAANPASATNAAAAATEPVRLSVFEVTSEKDIGYAASTALSGTRTNEKLENLPNSISVMTQEFIQDLAFNNYFDAVGFAANAENIANDLGTVGAVVGNRSGNQVNIRGLATVRQLRDGFPWYLVADVFNTERIEFGRGPGGLAYGDVDAGGIINISSKRASFRRSGSLQVRYDSFGTQRYSIDVNQPVIPNRLGLRVNAIKSEVEQGKQRQGRDLEGYAGALRWEPFRNRRTQLDAAYETGNTTYHLGHLGPTDSRGVYIRGTGTTALDADPNRPGVQTNGVGMLQLRAANVANHAWADLDGVINNWQSTPTNVFRLSTTVETVAAVSPTDPQNPRLIPFLRVPESIIPYLEDWAGPDNKHNSKYYAYTLELKHSFSDRFNVLIAHNGQFDETVRKQTYSSVGGFGGPGRSIFIDVNPVLPNPNGSGTTLPNPNFEQFFTYHTPFINPDGHRIANWRAQSVYDAQLPWSISQRVVLSANYRHEDNYQDNFSYGLTPQEIARRGYAGAAANFTNNLVYPIHYLKEGNGDATLGWNVRSGITQLFRNAAGSGINRRLDQSLTSGSINLLGSYFNGKVRTSLGLSRDHWLQSASQATRADPVTNEQRFVNRDNTLIPNRGTEKITAPLLPFAAEWSTNQTYGGVWHIFPWVSLTGAYFESSQFSDNYGLDLRGNALDPLNGEGTDFSLRFHLFGGRVEPSITYFDTKQENLSASVDAASRDELNPFLDQPFVNLVDYRDRTSTGWEYQVVANVTKHWTLTAGYSTNETVFTRFFPLLEARMMEARKNAQARGVNPDVATNLARQFLEDQEGNISSTKRATANLTTRYTFTEGILKGFAAGVSTRYQSGKQWVNLLVGGVEVLPAIMTQDAILTNPFFSYRRRLGRATWTLQLNINNLFDQRIDQGNSYRWPRYTEPRQFVYTVTAAF